MALVKTQYIKVNGKYLPGQIGDSVKTQILSDKTKTVITYLGGRPVANIVQDQAGAKQGQTTFECLDDHQQNMWKILTTEMSNNGKDMINYSFDLEDGNGYKGRAYLQELPEKSIGQNMTITFLHLK